MSGVRHNDLLSNGDNESIKEIITDAFSTNEDEAYSEISIVGKSNIPSCPASQKPLWMSSGRSLITRPDIDVDYAVELLKKEDQNTTV